MTQDPKRLDHAWRMALALAWHSYLGGTTPVGAVVVNAGGDVIAEGRNRRLEPPASDQQLSYSKIAHAEINAMALLPPTLRCEDHLLLTTLEPCAMCLGAAVQATFTRVRFAGRDPYAGASRMVIDTPQSRRRPLLVAGPLPDFRGRFAELIHVRWLLDVRASRPVLTEHEWDMPDLYRTASLPSTAELFRTLAYEGATVEDAMAATKDLLPS